MSPKRGDRVAPPPAPGEYDIIFGNSDAAKGWVDLSGQAAGPTRAAYLAIVRDPQPFPETNRHHRLRLQLAVGAHGGETLPQWQFEVTGGGRIWYLVDEVRRRVVLTYAGTGHPKATD